MALITIPYSFTVGTTISATEHNDNFNTIRDAINGNLDNANIKTNAAIADTKLNQITTASKVSGAALTLLGNIPSGAGTIPITNLPVSTDSALGTSEVYLVSQHAIKDYADTKLSGFGDWVDKSADYAAQTASADGFIVAYGVCGDGVAASMIGYTDTNSNPTTVRQKFSVPADWTPGANLSMMFPVKNGNYWKIVVSNCTPTVYWMPLS